MISDSNTKASKLFTFHKSL